MDKSKITTLFLDIGGILLTDGWGRGQRKNAIEKFGLDKDETDARNGLIWDVYESDKLTLDDYLNYTIFYTGRNFTKEEFIEFMYAQSKPLDGAIDYFKALKKQRGYKIVALSNESRELNAHRIKEFKLNEVFDFYISSCYVKMRKPDPDIYRMALDTAQVTTEQSVYIDDRLTYIEMAKGMGLETLHYTGIDSAKKYFGN